LLDRFLTQRDEEAFAALVRRHGPMVRGVCHRVLGHVQDAEDAFQATFLVLFRRAASIRRREAVGNWLYQVAYRTSLEARSAAAQRQAMERQVRSMPEPMGKPPDPFGDFFQVIDAELNQFPDKYRSAIVLCDLEGQPRRQAARELGIPEGTLSSRLAAGRRLLAARLARRGVTLSAGGLAASLSFPAMAGAVPPPLLRATVGAATTVAAGQATAAGVTSANVVALMEKAVRAMHFTKVRFATSVLLAVAVLGAGAGVVWTGATGRESEPVAAKAEEEPVARDAAKRPDHQVGGPVGPKESPDVWTLDFRFKDPRFATVDVPGQGKKPTWYLRYDVSNNTGESRTAVLDFELVLPEQNVVHRDQVQSKVEEAIRQIEDPTDQLKIKNSVTIAAEPIPPSKPGETSRPVTGIAIWDTVDPKAVRFTIFVSGLSNAWSVADPVPPSGEPVVRRKTLQLNFKRVDDRMVFVPPAQWVRAGKFRLPEKDERGKPGENPQPKDAGKKGQEPNKRFEQREAQLLDEIKQLDRDFQQRLYVKEDKIAKLHVQISLLERERADLLKEIEELRKGRGEGPGEKRSDNRMAKGAVDEVVHGPADEDAARRQVRFAIIEELERQRSALQAEERDRQINLEVVQLRLQALRKTFAEEKPTGIEADRYKERLASLEAQEEQLRTKNRDQQIYLQLLNERLRALRKELGEKP
jgi:RNA polymerase sigma factor (sigma-70 family)